MVWSPKRNGTMLFVPNSLLFDKVCITQIVVLFHKIFFSPPFLVFYVDVDLHFRKGVEEVCASMGGGARVWDRQKD